MTSAESEARGGSQKRGLPCSEGESGGILTGMDTAEGMGGDAKVTFRATVRPNDE